MFMFPLKNLARKGLMKEKGLLTDVGHSPLNPYHAGTELIQFNIVNTMVVDALAPYIARSSAAMILTM